MKQEDIFKAAEAAEFTRVKVCCAGVENKLCATDEWRGNLGAFAAQVEQRAIQRCIEFIRNGSFLTDDSPAKRFATEVTAEMEKQLLPQGMQPYLTEHGELLEITPENLGRIGYEMMKADPFGTKHNCLPRRDQMLSPIGTSAGSPDNPVNMTREHLEEFVPTTNVHYTDTPEVGEDGVRIEKDNNQ